MRSRRAHPAFEADDRSDGAEQPPPLTQPSQPPSPMLTARAAELPLQSQEAPTATPLLIHSPEAEADLRPIDRDERAPHPATAPQPLARSAIRAATTTATMRLTSPSAVQSPLGMMQPQQSGPTAGASQYRSARFSPVVPVNAGAAGAALASVSPTASPGAAAASAAFATAASPAASGAQTTRQQLLHRSHSVSGTPARAASPASTHRRPLSSSCALATPIASPLASPYAVARNALAAAASPNVTSPVARQVASLPSCASLQRAFAVEQPIVPASELAGAGILPLLRGLSDAEFRRVVERWLEGELSAPAGPIFPSDVSAAARAASSSSAAASSLHAGLVSSYLALHSWEHSSPLFLRTAFRFLSLSDLVRGARRTCRRWHQALQPLPHTEQERGRGWEESQMLQLPSAAASATPLSNSTLLSIFSSLPLLRSLSFVSLVHRRNGGFDEAFEWGSSLARMQLLLPKLTHLKLEGVALKTKDLTALLPSASSASAVASAHAELLDDSPSAAQLLRPSVCQLASLELLHCLAIDVRVMELLAALPSLHTLSLHSTEALTASRSCGLQLLSNSGANVQGPISPIASAARTPSHHQQLMQDASSADQCCFPSLTSLSLAPLSSDAALTHLLPCTRLQSLALTGCLSDTGLESLCVLASLASLRVEVLYELARGGTSALSPSAGAASRRGNGLIHSSMSAEEMSSLCDGRGLVALESLQHLRSLDVCIPALSIRGMEALCALSQLETLRIATASSSYYAPTTAAAQCVSPLASLPTFLSLLSFLPVLRSLDLSGLSFLSDEQLSFLPHPSVCARLRSLSLRGVQSLSDMACYWLGKLRALQFLDLRGCGGMRERRGIKELRANERMKDCVVLWSAADASAEEKEAKAPEPNPQLESAEASSSARSAPSPSSEPIRWRASASPPPLPPRSSSAASDRTDSPLSPPPHLQHQLGLAYSFTAAPSSPAALASKSRAEQESDQIAALAAASARATAALQMREELSKAESILQRLTANMAATVANNDARKNATPSPTLQQQQPQPLRSPSMPRSASFAESRDRPLSTSDFASPVRGSAPPPAAAVVPAVVARQTMPVRPPTPKLASKPKARSASSGGSIGDARALDDDAAEWMLQPLSADPASPVTNGFAASPHRPFDPSAFLSVDSGRSAAAPVPVPAAASSSLESAFDAAESAAMSLPFQMHPPPASSAVAHHRVSRSSPPQMTHAQPFSSSVSSSNGPVRHDEDDAAAAPDSHRSQQSSSSSMASISSQPLAPHALFKHKSLFDGAVLASAAVATSTVASAAAATNAPPTSGLSSSLPVPSSDESVSLHRTPRMRRTKSAQLATPNSSSKSNAKPLVTTTAS